MGTEDIIKAEIEELGRLTPEQEKHPAAIFETG